MTDEGPAEVFPEPSDMELDQTDEKLTHVEKRLRMSSCMELVKQHSARNSEEVERLLEDAMRFGNLRSEFDAKNYLFHTWLAKCYHNIRQREAQSFGSQQISGQRMQKILMGDLQRFSPKQQEVLQELLREDGVVVPEVEILGQKLSEWNSATAVGFSAAFLCAGLLIFLSWRLLSTQKTWGNKAKDARKPHSRRKEKIPGFDSVYCRSIFKFLE